MSVMNALLSIAGAALTLSEPPQPPSTPSCRSAGPEAVTVTWEAVSEATLYEIAIGVPSSIGGPDSGAPFGSLTVPPENTSALVDDLIDSTQYAVKVRAHVGYGGDQMILGWTLFSDAITCNTDAPHPLAPRGLRRGPGGLRRDTIDIRWDSPVRQTSGEFVVRYREVPDFTIGTLPPSSTNSDKSLWKWLDHVIEFTSPLPAAEIKSLMPGRSYEVVVEARHTEFGTQSCPSAVFRTADEATTWIAPHRVTENDLNTVDFLANHDSGTIEGDVGFMTMGGNSSHFFKLMSSPLTSYCVEIEKVDLTGLNRTSGNPPSIPLDPAFADYISCNGAHDDPPPGTGWGNYTCVCDNLIDRVIAHQTPDQINAICTGGATPGGHCECGLASLAASARYTGWMPTSLPWLNFHGPGRSGPWPPAPPAKITPFGGWYSHPADAKCADTTGRVGDAGCTWRRWPRAMAVYGKDLLAAGWQIGPPDNITTADVLSNLEAAKKAFAVVPLKPRCCGC